MGEDPQVRATKRRAFWRRNGGRFLGFGLVIALGATGVVLQRAGLLTGLTPDASGSSATSTPRVNLTTPFLGTEAGPWPDGAAGITVPETGPLGKYSAAQVKAFGERVRQVLVTGRLDRRVIVEGQTEHVFKLLAPEAQEQYDEHREKEKLPADGGSYLYTRIAPGYKLLKVEPKVKGEMKLFVDGKGKLTASTNYVFAFAFEPEQAEKISDPHEIIAIQRRAGEWTLEDNPQIRKSQHGVWWGEKFDGYDYLMSCAESEKELLAPTYREKQKPGGPTAKHDRKHYFDPNSPMDDEDGCK
ncbi:hypothetical protein N8J89_06995 [Crossiella sp. CA-258035]|uniref:hypothetical protein n=1 Tax=Crossiella sp. CA-258035 TaxID=2981138 RepID=UPI0024BCD688|nr:hypothetical protein [Crossiella sp. CA-258035]WHT20802.1 hypothetical protein N8J89_06995 [Crossiella sp. CA-258035]